MSAKNTSTAGSGAVSASTSKLTGNSTQSSDLPLVNVRSRSQEIFIPSITDYAEFSPRSLDSRSLVSAGSASADVRQVSKMIARARDRTKQQQQQRQEQQSDGDTIRASINGKEMIFDMDDVKKLPLTRLDILEAYLPKNLRHEAKAHRKLRIRGEAKKDVVFNILSGQAGSAMRSTLQEQISSGTQSIDSGQTMTVKSYNPVHDPSGAVSAPNSALTPPDGGSELAPVRVYSRGVKHRKTLWGTDIQQSIIEREEAIKRELREAEERRSLEISRVLEERKLAEEHELKLKLKVINTLFNKKVKFRDAKMANIAEKTLELNAQGLDLSHESIQKLHDEATKLMKADKLALSYDLTDEQSEAGSGVGNLRSVREGSMDSTGGSDSSVGGDSDGGGVLVQGRGSSKGRRPPRSRKKKKRRRRSDEDVLIFRTRDFKNTDDADGSTIRKSNEELSAAQDKAPISTGLLSSIEEMAMSQLRTKLHDLKKYINSHTSRKLMDSWNFIEGRIKMSTHMKSFVVTDSKGLAHPIQHSALPLSTLTQMLSSIRVRIGYEELHQLYANLGFISLEDAYFSRKVAALNVVLQQAEENSPQYHFYRNELLELTLDATEPLVTLNELKEVTFDKDPEERSKQIEKVVANKQRELDQIVAEKQRKETMKEQAEKRRQRLIIDFEGSLEQLNILDGDGKLTPEKLEEFLQMLLRCKKFVAKMLDDKVVNIPEDALAYLGLEVFPLAIQEKVKERKRLAWQKYKQTKLASGNSTAAAATGAGDESGSNPFLEELRKQQHGHTNESNSLDSGSITTTPSLVPHHQQRTGPEESHEEPHPFAAPNLPTVLEAPDSPISVQQSRSVTPRSPLTHTPRTITEQRTAITFPSSTDWDSSAASIDESQQKDTQSAADQYISDDNSSLGSQSIMMERGAKAESLVEALAEFAAMRRGDKKQDVVKETPKIHRDDSTVTSMLSPVPSPPLTPQLSTVSAATLGSAGGVMQEVSAAEASPVAPLSLSGSKSPLRHRISSVASMARTATSVAHTVKRKRRRKRFVWSLKRVLLTGPPAIVSLMREAASYGRGLQGMSYRDAISVLQYVAATKIQSILRCYCKRWRYSAARRKWKRIFNGIVGLHLTAWRVLTQHNIDTRQFCWRKLVAWRYYTKRAHQLREQFRCCYWPFYVWRRYANESGRAKEKAKFLVTRVLPTYTLLHIFRAWKKYSRNEGRLNLLAIRFQKKMIHDRYVAMVRWLRLWARKRRRIRRAWNRSGQYKLHLYRRNLIRIPFQIWCTYLELRKLTRGRIRTEFHALRKVLPIAETAHKKLSNSEKRLKMKLDEKKLREMRVRKVSRKQLKDHVKMRNRASSKMNKNRSPSRGGARGSVSAAASPNKPVDEYALCGPFPEFAVEVAKFYPNKEHVWDSLVRLDGLDIPRDETEDAELPVQLHHWFSLANVTPFPDSADLDNVIEPGYDKLIMRRIDVVRNCFEATDKWNIFEAAMRFHHFARRALMNLRDWAVKRRRWRKFRNRRHYHIKCIVWGELRLNADQGAKRAALQKASEAEALAGTVRSHQVQKMVRLRKATMDVNAAYGRDYGDPWEEDERANQKMKNLNLIDSDDEDYLEKEKQRLANRQAEIKRKQAIIDKSYVPPDLLVWDRNDRAAEESMAIKMVSLAQRITKSAQENVVFADKDTTEYRANAAKLEEMVVEVIDTETKNTNKSLEKQKHYIANFKIHAADKLITVLSNIWEQVQKSMLQQEAKIYFRALRLPMLYSRSKSMFRRKRIQNWLRICKRLNTISKHALYYNRIRTKWVFLNRWLKFLSIEKLNPSPGIQSFVKRKALLHPDFDLALSRNGFVKSVYYDNSRLRDCISDFRVVFSRWKCYTQELVIFRVMEEKAAELSRLKILQRCFFAIKMELHAAELMQLIANQLMPFKMQRVQADLDQISKKFLAFRRKSTAHVVTKYNKKFNHKIKELNKKAVSFKKFMFLFHREAQMRISTEQRMLSDAFDNRGTQIFEDHRLPPRDHHRVPLVMSRLDGRPFADPHVFNADGRAVTIPGGFKISKLKLALQSGRGIIGWQIYWGADGAREIESPQRGNWNAAMTLAVQELVIPREDFIVGIEYIYEGAMTLALRLKLFFGGFTKWVGSKLSLASLSIYLSVDDNEIVPREPYEDERDANKDKEELEYPALPDRFIIGLTGVVHSGRATNVGMVVRKVQKQGLFSYHWVNDELLRIESERTQEAIAQQSLAASIDAKSIPSHLSRVYKRTIEGIDEDGEYDPNQSHADSLTMSQVPGESIEGADGMDFYDSDSESDADSSSVGKSSEASSLPKVTRQRRMGVVTTTATASAPTAAGALVATAAESNGQALTSSEIQFFDIIRMRTTELSHALIRVEEFGERLWTDKTIRVDPVLGKLSNITVVKALTRWFFNAISKRLMPLSSTEKPAMELLRTAKRLHNRADSVRVKMNGLISTANVMETSVQPWTGKGILHPAERAAKKAHNLKIQVMRNDANRMNNEISTLRLQAVVAEKRGINLLPRIVLSQYMYNNYRIKIAAARHKESLLERISLEEVKSGLFGTDQKEKLLSKEQMQAIHDSLTSKKLEMKDTSSLERMVDDVLNEEGEEKNKVQDALNASQGKKRFERKTISGGAHFYASGANKNTKARSPTRRSPTIRADMKSKRHMNDDDSVSDDDTIASNIIYRPPVSGGAGSRPGSRNSRVGSPSRRVSNAAGDTIIDVPVVAPLSIKTIDFEDLFERPRSASLATESHDLVLNSGRPNISRSGSRRFTTLSRGIQLGEDLDDLVMPIIGMHGSSRPGTGRSRQGSPSSEIRKRP